MKPIIPKIEIHSDDAAVFLIKSLSLSPTTSKHSKHSSSEESLSNDSIIENEQHLLFHEHIQTGDIEEILHKVLNIRIRSPFHYQRAFVHKSILRLHRGLDDHLQQRIPEYMKESNERLELLGDAVLGLCVADFLLSKFPDVDEGIITIYRTRIVKGDTLAMFARNLGLQHKLLMSSQTRKTSGGSSNNNLLENAFEALIGAIYYDQGLDVARNFIIQCIHKYFKLDQLNNDDNFKDMLLRLTQQLKLGAPHYEKILETGKPNQKEFTVVVYIDGKRFGKGFGNKIKRAEQDAAKHAIERLQNSKY